MGWLLSLMLAQRSTKMSLYISRSYGASHDIFKTEVQKWLQANCDFPVGCWYQGREKVHGTSWAYTPLRCKISWCWSEHQQGPHWWVKKLRAREEKQPRKREERASPPYRRKDQTLFNLESYNHILTESFELKGTFNGHLVQLPCDEQGHLQLHQTAQSPVQPELGWLRGWGIIKY